MDTNTKTWSKSSCHNILILSYAEFKHNNLFDG